MTDALPTGEVTYLFTDIEGSTRLLNRVGDGYGSILAAHHAVIRQAIAVHDGIELKTEGDAFFVVFTSPTDAVAASVDAQRAIAGDPTLAAERVKVRMGLHPGTAVLGGDNYVGMDVHIASRVSGAAHGGQILVTESVRSALPASAGVKNLGDFWLKDIEEPVSIDQITAPGLESNFAPISAAPTHPKNAPRDTTSFLGRETETADAIELLTANRLVTLTGPGGTGKTRLGIEIGAGASRMFSDGVFFVPLAGISDVDSVPNSLTEALGAPASDTSLTPIENLTRYLQHRQTLLVIDNFEHVLGAASYVQNVLDTSPGTKVLATSRTPLGLRGERELAISPLDVSTTGAQLFADRAKEVRASFEMDESNEEDIKEIVRRLDGLPLAIELAAARIRMMSPSSILQTLDPLTLARSAGELTLNDTIGWSFDLLSEPEQQLMIRLGVFPTGANFDQIIEVCQPRTDLGLDPINGIGSLVEHSLLVGDDTSDSPRFRMLETIREFSVRKLRESSEEATIRHRHMESFAELIEKAHPNLEGPDSAEWMEVLGRENANLQAAFTYAVETSNADIAQRIVAAAWRFWQSRGHLVEGTEAATKALALDGGSGPVRAAALDAAGSIAYWTGDRVACRSFYEQAVKIRREGDDKASLLNALYNLSFPVSDEDGLEAATALLDEAIVIAEEIGDERMLGMIFTALARTWLHASPADSQRYAKKAIEAGENIGDPIFVAWATSLVGGSQQMMGDSLAAVATFQRGLRTFHEHGDLSGIAVDITGLADIARHVGDDTSALYFVGAVTRIREDSGIGVQTALDGTLTEFSTPESIAALSPELAAAYESGRSESMNAAVAKALEWEPS